MARCRCRSSRASSNPSFDTIELPRESFEGKSTTNGNRIVLAYRVKNNLPVALGYNQSIAGSSHAPPITRALTVTKRVLR